MDDPVPVGRVLHTVERWAGHRRGRKTRHKGDVDERSHAETATH